LGTSLGAARILFLGGGAKTLLTKLRSLQLWVLTLKHRWRQKLCSASFAIYYLVQFLIVSILIFPKTQGEEEMPDFPPDGAHGYKNLLHLSAGAHGHKIIATYINW
jgi:hypothetical protein